MITGKSGLLGMLSLAALASIALSGPTLAQDHPIPQALRIE